MSFRLAQDEASALAESMHVPDWFPKATTTNATDAAKPIHQRTILVMRLSQSGLVEVGRTIMPRTGRCLHAL